MCLEERQYFVVLRPWLLKLQSFLFRSELFPFPSALILLQRQHDVDAISRLLEGLRA